MVAELSLVVGIITMLLDAAILVVLILEYYYDKKLYDKKINRVIDKKANTVVVEVENGMAIVRHKPKNISVVINNKSDGEPEKPDSPPE